MAPHFQPRWMRLRGQTKRNGIADRNPTTGALTLAGTPVAAQNPTGIAADPSGTFVYVTNPNLNTIAVFSINPATGALTEVAGSPFAANGGPFGIAVRKPRQECCIQIERPGQVRLGLPGCCS